MKRTAILLILSISAVNFSSAATLAEVKSTSELKPIDNPLISDTPYIEAPHFDKSGLSRTDAGPFIFGPDIAVDKSDADLVPLAPASLGAPISLLDVFTDKAARGRRYDRVQNARYRAVTILAAAVNVSNNRTINKGFNALSDTIVETGVKFPNEGYDFKKCIKKENLVGFAVLGQPPIYLCAATMNESTDYLAQVIIHEAAHVGGVANECIASRLEVAAMMMGTGKLAMVNNYLDKCGIVPSDYLLLVN